MRDCWVRHITAVFFCSWVSNEMSVSRLNFCSSFPINPKEILVHNKPGPFIKFRLCLSLDVKTAFSETVWNHVSDYRMPTVDHVVVMLGFAAADCRQFHLDLIRYVLPIWKPHPLSLTHRFLCRNLSNESKPIATSCITPSPKYSSLKTSSTSWKKQPTPFPDSRRFPAEFLVF